MTKNKVFSQVLVLLELYDFSRLQYSQLLFVYIWDDRQNVVNQS